MSSHLRTSRVSRSAPGLLALVLMALLATFTSQPAAAKKVSASQDSDGAKAKKTVAAMVEGMRRQAGLLVLYSDEKEGQVWLELPPAGW